jgi:ribose transport system permease protein
MHKGKILNQLRKKEFIPLAAVVLMIIFLSSASNLFWDKNNLASLQTSIAPTAIVAIGMMLLLITGKFDLSVGSTMALTGIMVAKLFEAGLPVLVVLPLGLLVGIVVGSINGFFVAYEGINPLIATIGMMFAARGVAVLMMSNQYQDRIQFPVSFIQLGAGRFLGVYYMVWIVILLIIIFSIILKFTSFGRKLYYIGGNYHAAQVLGFKNKLIIFGMYAFTGFLSSLAGILSVARYENANRYLGSTTHLLAIIACIVGGASLSGGRGSIIGGVLGVIFLSLISNTFNLLEIKSQYQDIIIGMVLVAVVFIDGYLTLKKQRALGKL